MNRQEWRDACQRTLNRLANLKAEAEGQQPKQAEGQKSKRVDEGSKVERPKAR